ncbi:MAG: FHA domain-containing protein [Gammaproteobacteria bacterium]|nr:FHA domain-containing protein [Gammaproteobacteria bacterium]
MEPLIIEIKTRGLHRYHAFDKPELRLGRALDNDIILSDPTVEPYHIKIRRHEDGNIELQNLAKVNPAQFNNQLEDEYSTTNLPIDIRMGRISVSILARDHQVTATKSLAGNGRPDNLLWHPLSAVLLLSLCVLGGGLEFYFTSYNALKWENLIKFVFRESVLSIAAFILILSIFERLLVNRWEIKLITISVTLVYLLYLLLSVVASELMYLFSSDLTTSIFNLVWYLVFIPAAVSLYLIRVTHLGQRKSVLLATLISSPFAILAIMQNPTINTLLDDFSATANYQKSLSPLNLHLSKTISIETFFEQAGDLEPGEFSD